MDLDFTEEQQMIVRHGPRSMFEEHSGVDVVRQLEDDPKGYSDGLWKQIGESGLLGLTIPSRVWRAADRRCSRPRSCTRSWAARSLRSPISSRP